MTWDELKAFIDERLKELGRDGSVEIWYIDTSFPYKEELRVELGEDQQLKVWS